MQLHFKAISELGKPGEKWQNLFTTHWPAYNKWVESKKELNTPSLKASKAALKKYMPEMMPTYNRLCRIVKADSTASRFLTGFQPPVYLQGCAQAVLKGEEPRLIRNYDYHPDLIEGTQMLTSWNGKKVIATSDCLIGALDGMNEDGLAISLSFGGQKATGVGFGIPFILRYVLEFCRSVEEAVTALCRIPTHVAYNVTIVDKSGTHRTVQLAPNKKPEVTHDIYATNHQGSVDWPENAVFNQTLERAASLGEILLINEMDPESVLNAFMAPPLYNVRFKEGFGTLYTVEYLPKMGSVNMHWPGEQVSQDFENFTETYRCIDFNKITSNLRHNKHGVPKREPKDWQKTVIESIVNAMARKPPSAGGWQNCGKK